MTLPFSGGRRNSVSTDSDNVSSKVSGFRKPHAIHEDGERETSEDYYFASQKNSAHLAVFKFVTNRIPENPKSCGRPMTNGRHA